MLAMAETAPQPRGTSGNRDRPDRRARRTPFTSLMKKLSSFKGGNSGDQTNGSKNNTIKMTKKRHGKNNNPYPESGRVNGGPCTQEQQESQYSLSTTPSGVTASGTSLGADDSVRLSTDGVAPTTGGRSLAPTVTTDHEASRSIAARSHGASSLANTCRTANGGLDSRRGGDSTFSSPAPSVRSLTTTLTTIQSVGPNTQPTNNHVSHHGHLSANSQVIHFNQPFPTTSPASAIPAHLTPSGSQTGHPTTYASATANNLLTDNASIVTLASSSKRHRRRSFDTDASVRALAPTSLYGGSRESLPLSVLSATMDGPTAVPTTPGLHRGTSNVAERTSIYSATGILSSERNSLYAKTALNGSTAAGIGDGASVHSGLLGHGRADSVSGSIGGGVGLATSPLASPRENGVDEKDEEAAYREEQKE